jgi:hypothetical protein
VLSQLQEGGGGEEEVEGEGEGEGEEEDEPGRFCVGYHPWYVFVPSSLDENDDHCSIKCSV